MSFFDHLPGTGYVCAHRGARSIAPENTLLAFELAYRCGADLCEADVQFSADGEPIIFHDDTLERTTDIASLTAFLDRKPWRVADLNFAELHPLNCGTPFIDNDPFGTIASGEVDAELIARIRGQKIVRLEDLLRFCREFNYPFNLEIKDQHGQIGTGTVVASILDCLELTGMTDLTLVSSFNHDYLCEIGKLNAGVATAALVEVHPPEDLISYLQELGVTAYHPDWQICDAMLIDRLSQAGLRTNLWTVNDPVIAQRFMAAGAGFICTDWPQKLALESHSA